jgi:cysteine-rich repeat protein
MARSSSLTVTVVFLLSVGGVVALSFLNSTERLKGFLCPADNPECISSSSTSCNVSNCPPPAVCFSNVCTVLSSSACSVGMPTCAGLCATLGEPCNPTASRFCCTGASTASLVSPPCCSGNCVSFTCLNSSGFCGNGTLEAGEVCDDGNTNYSDACTNCHPAVCGDGYIRTGVEQCDDGNTSDGDGCNVACAIEPDYACTGEPSVCTMCGNGIITPPEVCDNGKHCPSGGNDKGKQCTANADCADGPCAVVSDGCSPTCNQKRCTLPLGYPGYPPQIPPATTPLPPGNIPGVTIDCAPLQAYMHSFKTLCENMCGGPGTCVSVSDAPPKYVKCDGPDPGNISGDSGVLEAYWVCPHHYGNCPHPPPGPPPFPWVCSTAGSSLLQLCTGVPPPILLPAAPLPPPLVVPAAAALLAASDTDGSGTLSSREMFSALVSMVRAMANDDAAFDLNADGDVNRSDLSLLITAIRAELSTHSSSRTMR